MIATLPNQLEPNSTPAAPDLVASLQSSTENPHPILSHEGIVSPASTQPATTLSNEQNPSTVVSSAGGLTNPAYQNVEAGKDAETTRSEPANSNVIPPRASGEVPVSMGEASLAAPPMDLLDPLTRANLGPVMSALSDASDGQTVAPTFLAKSPLPMNLPLPTTLGLPAMPAMASSMPVAPANLGLTLDSDGALATLRKGTIMRPNPQSTTAR